MQVALKSRADHATIKVRNAAAIRETLAGLGADPAKVLRAAGIEPEAFSRPDNTLPFSALDRLVSECMRATGCEHFGLLVGARTEPTGIGLVGILSIHAPTVRDALQLIAAGLKTSDTGGAVVLEQIEDLASFGYVVTAPNIDTADQIVDASIAIIFNIMRSLCGPGWRPLRVRLTRGPPRDPAPFAKFFRAPIDYSAPVGALDFPAATLDAPARQHNPAYTEILAPLLQEAMAKTRADFLTTVQSVIRSQIGGGAITRERVARALNLHPRTLAHRLEALGVTFSGLADEAKYEAACALLTKDRRMSEIAGVLGFAEQSAFTRAFKGWSGKTPARWRAELR